MAGRTGLEALLASWTLGQILGLHGGEAAAARADGGPKDGNSGEDTPHATARTATRCIMLLA